MEIAGLQKTTLLDYPGRIACTVFLPGLISLTHKDEISGIDSVNDGISEVGDVYVHPEP